MYILGGARIYEEALRRPDVKYFFVTQLVEHPSLPCTVHFRPNFDGWQAMNITRNIHRLLISSITRPSEVRLIENVSDEAEDCSIVEADIVYKIMFYKRL